MLITFVTESHQFQDDKQTEDVVTHGEFDNGIVRDHERRLSEHDTTISEHCKNIGWLWDKVNDFNGRISELAEKVGGVETNVNAMPQVLRDSLEHVLTNLLGDKLEIGARLVEELREERKRVAAQLDDLRKQRDEMRAMVADLNDKCAEAKSKLDGLNGRLSGVEKIENEIMDDFSMQVAEFRLSVPVPKKFAKFLFVQPDVKTEK